MLIRKNGVSYDGFFKNNKQNGNGKFVFADGDEKNRKHYIGSFKDDHFHGYGTIVLNNGDSY